MVRGVLCWVCSLPTMLGMYTPPGIYAPCTSPGTPSTSPAHDRRVYTEHARNSCPTLDHRVAELTVADEPLTVVAAYRRCWLSVLMFVEERQEDGPGPMVGESVDNVDHEVHRCCTCGSQECQQCAHLLLTVLAAG